MKRKTTVIICQILMSQKIYIGAIKFLEMLLLFLEQQDDEFGVTNKNLPVVHGILRKCKAPNSQVQSILTDYFN